MGKDGRPPDVKAMAAAAQEHGALRSRALLLNWETTLVGRMLVLWQLRSGGLVEHTAGRKSRRSTHTDGDEDLESEYEEEEDNEADEQANEQANAANEKADAAKRAMEEEVEKARQAQDKLDSAQRELDAALASGDTAAVERAQTAMRQAEAAQAQAQESMSSAQDSFAAADKESSAAKKVGKKGVKKGVTGKSSMVGKILQKKLTTMMIMMTMMISQRQRGQWLLLLVCKWRLRSQVNRAEVQVRTSTEADFTSQLKMVKQREELCQVELESRTEELEAARQSRIKFRSQCIKLRRKAAQSMMMIWMLMAKDAEERQYLATVTAVKRWIHNCQVEAHLVLCGIAEQAATDNDELLNDNEELSKNNESLKEDLETEKEQSEAARVKFTSEQESAAFEAAEEKLRLEQENAALIEEREKQVRDAIDKHAAQMKLLQKMTGIMTSRLAHTINDTILRQMVVSWTQNYNLSLVHSLRSSQAQTLDRVRKMSKQTVLLEEQNANYKHLLTGKKERIEVLVAKQAELETEQIPTLNAEIAQMKLTEEKMVSDYHELQMQSTHYKTWLGIKLAAAIVLKVMVIRKAEWLRAVKSNFAAHQIGRKISPVMMSMLLTAKEDRIWCARLALPFLHWHEVSTRRILTYKLKRQIELAEKSQKHSDAMETKVSSMEAEQDQVLADLRFKVQDEIKVLEHKIEELQAVIVKKVEERDNHVRRMTKQHHDIQDLHGEIALEQRRRLYAALITTRSFFWKRAVVVTLQRWRTNLQEVVDPSSARNQLELAVGQVKQLAEEIKRMQTHSEVSHKGGEKSVKQVQMLQQRDKMMRTRGKQVFGLLVFSLWHATSRWQIHSQIKCFQLWHLIARSSAELKRATSMLQQQQQNLAGGVDQQRQLVKEVERLQEQADDLIQVCTRKDEEVHMIETRLFQNKKDSETKMKQLEESFMDAMKATALNRELLDDKDHDLQRTKEIKDEAVELIGQQEDVIVEQKKAEAKLTELYEHASDALTKEVGHSAVFTTAVLKAHYLTCKMFGIVKLAKGGRSDNISPDNLPLNNGVDVVRQDELMLREVYHWIKRMRQQDQSKHLNAGVAPVAKPTPDLRRADSLRTPPVRNPQYAPIEYLPVEKPATAGAHKPTTVSYGKSVIGPAKSPSGDTTPDGRPKPFVLPLGSDIFANTSNDDDVQVSSPVHSRTFHSIDEWADEVTSPKRSSPLPPSPLIQPPLDPLAARICTPETPTFAGNKFNALPSIN